MSIMLTPIEVIFYLFATLAVTSALTVIMARDPVRSVLALVVTFFSMAGIWLLLQAEFLALILILVYVGAVMTLFLFVVMMLNVNTERKQSTFVRYLPFGLLLVGLIVALLILSVSPNYLALHASNATMVDNLSNTEQLGQL